MFFTLVSPASLLSRRLNLLLLSLATLILSLVVVLCICELRLWVLYIFECSLGVALSLWLAFERLLRAIIELWLIAKGIRLFGGVKYT